MRTGICVGLDALPSVADTGFDFAEMTCSVLQPEKNDSEFARALKMIKSSAVPVEAFNCFLPAQLKVVGPEANLDKAANYMDIVLRRAREAGAEIMVFGSGGARNTDGDFPIDRAWEQLAHAAELAAQTAEKYGITIAMEPLYARACKYFNRVDQGAALVDKVRHPNLKLLADLFHFTEAKEPARNIVDAGNRLAHVHLATPSLTETGQGKEYDFKGFLGALKQAGYNKRVSVEDNPGLLRDIWGDKDKQRKALRAIADFIAQTL